MKGKCKARKQKALSRKNAKKKFIKQTTQYH